MKSILTRERILFGLVSGSVFLFCTGFFYCLYGWDFLHEALLYHLTRTDPRHNFSIYFYHIYLQYERKLMVVEKLISFLPQLIVQLVLILKFAQDLPFCCFVQTVAFVAFNKVCIWLRYYITLAIFCPVFLVYYTCFRHTVWNNKDYMIERVSYTPGSLLAGNNSTILCMVLLSFASYTIFKQYETEVERHFLHNLVGRSSTSLADVGLFAWVQGKECLSSTVDGQHLILSCKHISYDFSHPASPILSSFLSIRKYICLC